ncbi:MAG: S8 family serine peptidase [Planctomycetota bacterium]
MDHQGRGSPVVTQSLRLAMQAEPNAPQRVWVFFTDKNLPTENQQRSAIANQSANLNPKSAQRRRLRRTSSGLADWRDLPLEASYIRAVTNTGAVARHESLWLNGISVEATLTQVTALEALPFVRRIQPVARAARRKVPVEQRRQESIPRGSGAAWYNASYDQLTQVNVVAAHDVGYTGTGIVIGILDTGFNRSHDAFNQTTGGAHPVQIIDEHDFINNDGDTTQQPGDPDGQSSHGTYILGVMGAFFPTVLVGAAFDAQFLLAKTEDVSQEVPAEEDNYVAGIEWLEANGADMATSSLGYIDWYTQADLDGLTAVTTIAVNTATDNGMPCCTAAGNEGHDSNATISHLIAPADALKVLTCGAVDNTGAIASFSSDGPSADGRVKPEVLARGISTQTTSFSTNTNIVGVNGTSLSTPVVAGGVALIVQAHPSWSVDKIRRALFHNADLFLGTSAFDSLFVRGYGVINVMGAIQFVHSDINGDGVADGRDIAPFIAAVVSGTGSVDERRRADVDASGAANALDIPVFVDDLLGS